MICAVLLSFASLVAQAQEHPALVAFATGVVDAQPGELKFAEPAPGSTLKANPFAQYKGPDKQTTAEVKWKEGTERRRLAIGDRVNVGEIVETDPLGRLRLFLNDDSIVDIGPSTLVALQKYEMNAQSRHVIVRLLKGKVRVLVVRKLPGRSFYQLTTPGALVSVRGTDFIVHTKLNEGDAAETSILGVRGQVTADLVRLAKKAVVYTQPIVINTNSKLFVKSADGYALEYELQDKMGMKELNQFWDKHAPFTDPLASPVGSPPFADMLPGTGVPRVNRLPVAKSPLPVDPAVAELEAEHPADEAIGLQPSGNFRFPDELEHETSLVYYRLGPHPMLLGPTRVDRLPYEVLRTAAPTMVEARPQ